MVNEGSAIIVQGGGTRGIFGAGVLDAMMDANMDFSCIIGTSAGALAAYNYVAGCRGRAREFIMECMQGKEFASLGNLVKKGTYFNFEYMFNEVPKTLPIDMEYFRANPIKFYCGTTGVFDGKAHYFEKSEPYFDNAIAASSSLPLISSPVEVDGKFYLDGAGTCGIPFQKALDEGYSKIVVVLTRARDYRKKKVSGSKAVAFKAMYRKNKEYLQCCLNGGESYNEEMRRVFELEKEGRAFVICPEIPPKVGRKERDKKKLDELYHQGYDIAMKLMPELKRFLGVDQ